MCHVLRGFRRNQARGVGAEPVHVDARVGEDAGREALSPAEQAEQDVPGADVVVLQSHGLAQRQLEHLLGAPAEWNVALRSRPACLRIECAQAEARLGRLTDLVQVDSDRGERLRMEAVFARPADPCDPAAQIGDLEPMVVQRTRGRAVTFVQQRDQQMLVDGRDRGVRERSERFGGRRGSSGPGRAGCRRVLDRMRFASPDG